MRTQQQERPAIRFRYKQINCLLSSRDRNPRRFLVSRRPDGLFHLLFHAVGQLFYFIGLADYIKREHMLITLADGFLEFVGQLKKSIGIALDLLLPFLVGLAGGALQHFCFRARLAALGSDLRWNRRNEYRSSSYGHHQDCKQEKFCRHANLFSQNTAPIINTPRLGYNRHEPSY